MSGTCLPAFLSSFLTAERRMKCGEDDEEDVRYAEIYRERCQSLIDAIARKSERERDRVTFCTTKKNYRDKRRPGSAGKITLNRNSRETRLRQDRWAKGGRDLSWSIH